MGVARAQTYAHKYTNTLADLTQRENFSTSTLFMQFCISLIYKNFINAYTFFNKSSAFKTAWDMWIIHMLEMFPCN